MSGRERQRMAVLVQVKDGTITLAEAARAMAVGYRQAKRLWRRYRCKGDRGLVHGLRGRPGNRARDGALREAVLAAYAARYAGFGPTLAAEHLAEDDGLVVTVNTLRRWLMAAGLWSRQRRRRPQRQRRPRREHVGELVQMDGSEHDWFEGRGPHCVLMVMVDDASGWTHAQFHAAETTQAAFATLRGYLGKRGVPCALYVDRDSIYVVNPHQRGPSVQECLEKTGPLTQFGRAMKELGVRIIRAHSPQAKGRVERMNGTLQDRLVKELRLAGISNLAAANRFLEERFLERHNRRLAVAPAQAADLHRPVAAALGRGRSLDDVLCFQEERVVQNDWCVMYQGQVLQLQQRQAVRAGQKLTVRQRLDGTLSLSHRGLELKWRALPARPRPTPVKPTLVHRLADRRAAPWKPAAEHPWRRAGSAAAAPAARRSLGSPGSAPARLRSPALRQGTPATVTP